MPPWRRSANAFRERGERWLNRPLEGRHALITGGGTGIGAAAAELLSAAGAKVSLLGRRRRALQEVASKVGGAAIRCDVTDRDSIASAFEEARAANGPIDLLIVNAGIAESAPFHKMTRESWDRIISVNLTGAFERCRRGFRDLLKSEDARIVFIASVASLRGVPYAAHYAASKHGLLGLMRFGCGICQVEDDGERHLPRLCRHADDRPVGRARVADHWARRRAMHARRSPT